MGESSQCFSNDYSSWYVKRCSSLRDAHGVYTILTINFPYFISYLTFMLVYGYGCTYSVFVHLYTYITSINQCSYFIFNFKLVYMNIDAHTACLCICMHIYNSKSTQNKRYTPYSFFNLQFSSSKVYIFIKQNRIEARLRPDGIWLK